MCNIIIYSASYNNICSILIIITIHFIYFIVDTAQSVNQVLLTSNVNQENIAYDAQTVTFMCTIRGTGILVLNWISNDYIGSEDYWLQFSSTYSPGRTETSSINPTTVATLISANTYTDSGVTEIVSELQITASVQHINSSITCQINGNGASNTVMFRKAKFMFYQF